MRGEAYLELGDGERAATEFQKFIDHRGRVGGFIIGALADLYLGRAYGTQGDTAKTKRRFLVRRSPKLASKNEKIK